MRDMHIYIIYIYSQPVAVIPIYNYQAITATSLTVMAMGWSNSCNQLAKNMTSIGAFGLPVTGYRAITVSVVIHIPLVYIILPMNYAY